MFKIKNIIVVFVIIIFSTIMYLEYENTKKTYFKEKIYDLELQYNDKLFSSKILVEALYGNVLKNKQITKIMNDASKDINKTLNRNNLYNLFKDKYIRMKKRGILQFHFHLANGDSFLRFHKPKKFGDNLMDIRNTIKTVIKTKKSVYDFEIGRYFEGFRYVYPLFHEGEYVGSVESSISVSNIMSKMQQSLDAKYYMILRQDVVKDTISPEHVKKYYKNFDIDDNFYMSNHGSENIETLNSLKYIKNAVSKELNKDKTFVVISNKNVFTFIPIISFDGKSNGYIFSSRVDNTMHHIFNLQVIKWIIGLFLIFLVNYYYRLTVQKSNSILQLQKVIDKTTLVSKTDVSGRITYVNDAFVEISGFTEKELIGKKHSIVKSDNTPKKVFKDIWKTIKNKQVWYGKITNQKKDGKYYTVDASIVPILDINDNITEYIAIRHDITELEELQNQMKEINIDLEVQVMERITEVVQLNKEIEDTQKEVVFQMGAIGESRSKETGNHVKRVAEYSYILAILYGLEEKEAQLLKQASPMHDIGKVGIPDNVLKKPGKLDKDEWVIMMTHSELGYEMLKHSTRPILKAAATVANEHHEKWDGSGYPNGLDGENIHIYGRITAIADVFDALGSDRVYKKAWDDEKIFTLIKEEKGKHFDPTLVDMFLSNLDRFLEVRDTFKDDIL